MGAKRIYTDEEIAWLEENYNTKSQRDCAKYLQVSAESVRGLAKKLGLVQGRKSEVGKDKQSISMIVQGEGYCLDCEFYNTGGICGKNGKLTGALHQKKCFKEKEYEEGSNN